MRLIMKDECLLCGAPLKFLENDELIKQIEAKLKKL